MVHGVVKVERKDSLILHCCFRVKRKVCLTSFDHFLSIGGVDFIVGAFEEFEEILRIPLDHFEGNSSLLVGPPFAAVLPASTFPGTCLLVLCLFDGEMQHKAYSSNLLLLQIGHARMLLFQTKNLFRLCRGSHLIRRRPLWQH